jgi:hypothetical protein
MMAPIDYEHTAAKPADEQEAAWWGTPNPPGDVSVTAAGCAACGQPLPVGRSRRFCSPPCRQAAYRRRY